MIYKRTIKQRKAIYGNNFETIAPLWSEYLGKEITPKDVSKMMALMKTTRIDFITNKLQELKKSKDFNEALVLAEVQTLNYSLEDSKKDFENYNWIAENFKEYEEL